MRRNRPVIVLTSVVAAALAACTVGVDRADPDPPQPTQTATGDTRPPVTMPDTPAGEAASWIVDNLTSDDAPSPEDIAARFAPDYLADRPAAEIGALFDELRGHGSWAAVDIDAAGGDAVLRLHDGAGRPWRVPLSADSTGAITAFDPRPAVGGPRIPAANWAEVHEQLTAIDIDAGLLVANVDDGTCSALTSLDPQTPRPLASMFKLYLLEAVADAVEAGRLSWQDMLTVTDEVRSLPSGQMQDAPNGAEFSVAGTAAAMIAISDNTAADLLAATVGTDAVVAAMTDLGHASPELNVPFLTTREYFTVGWGPQSLREPWSQADANARQAILDDLPGGPLEVRGFDVDDPAWAAGVDWFGSPDDVCAAQVGLNDRPAGDAEMLRTILGHNRGVTIDEQAWPYVAFKGGSAPGVVTGSWLGERSDGTRFVVVLQVARDRPVSKVDRATVFALAEDAFALLAGE